MSLGVQVKDVAAVLLADGWHDVADKSFRVDDYEYEDGSESLLENQSPAFSFDGTDGQWYVGPLTSVLSLRISVGESPTT